MGGTPAPRACWPGRSWKESAGTPAGQAVLEELTRSLTQLASALTMRSGGRGSVEIPAGSLISSGTQGVAM